MSPRFQRGVCKDGECRSERTMIKDTISFTSCFHLSSCNSSEAILKNGGKVKENITGSFQCLCSGKMCINIFRMHTHSVAELSTIAW